nr:TonB-dependent receptor [Brevundimonas diminuta]
MKRLAILRGVLASGVCALALATAAHAQAPRPFDLPAGDLSVTLEAYIRQSGAQLIYQPSDVRNRRSARVSGSLTPEEALNRLLAGTGLRVARDATGAMMIVRPQPGTAGEGATGDATQVGDIVVTGSRIRGAPPTAPVHVVSDEEIKRSGFGSVADVIRSLPENFSGGQNPNVVEAGNFGNSATVNLRGFGADATLVLVNGRRLASDAGSQSTDVSGIPLSAVQRIEIVTDGSSALYGSDAIAGVANFILKKDFDGTELGLRISGTTRGGGAAQTYTALTGVARADWNVMAALEYENQEGVKAKDRDFTSSAVPNTDLLRPQERTSLFLSGAYSVNDRISLSADALLSDRKTDHFVQYTSAGGWNRFVRETSAFSVAAGLDVDLGRGWRFEGSLVEAQSRVRDLSVTATTQTVTKYQNELMLGEGAFSGLTCP